VARMLIVVRIPFAGLGPEDIMAQAPIGERESEADAGFGAHWGRMRVELMETLNARHAGASLADVHVFLEGLSVGGRDALRIVTDMASQGSPNCKLVLELVGRGARLEQTEDPRLLRDRDRLLRDALAAPSLDNRVKARRLYEENERKLVAARDAYVAKRIDQAVEADGVAVLSVGPAHDVEKLVAADFHVTMLPSALPLNG